MHFSPLRLRLHPISPPPPTPSDHQTLLLLKITQISTARLTRWQSVNCPLTSSFRFLSSPCTHSHITLPLAVLIPVSRESSSVSSCCNAFSVLRLAPSQHRLIPDRHSASWFLGALSAIGNLWCAWSCIGFALGQLEPTARNYYLLLDKVNRRSPAAPHHSPENITLACP